MTQILSNDIQIQIYSDVAQEVQSLCTIDEGRYIVDNRTERVSAVSLLQIVRNRSY